MLQTRRRNSYMERTPVAFLQGCESKGVLSETILNRLCREDKESAPACQNMQGLIGYGHLYYALLDVADLNEIFGNLYGIEGSAFFDLVANNPKRDSVFIS